tara:strand:- start:186 stop:386 length:201 start_codon:yes stop_codon:yes gene_type:complete
MSKEYIEDRIEQLERDNESLREQVNDLIAEVNDLYESDPLMTKVIQAVKELQVKIGKPHEFLHPLE